MVNRRVRIEFRGEIAGRDEEDTADGEVLRKVTSSSAETVYEKTTARQALLVPSNDKDVPNTDGLTDREDSRAGSPRERLSTSLGLYSGSKLGKSGK